MDTGWTARSWRQNPPVSCIDWLTFLGDLSREYPANYASILTGDEIHIRMQ